MTKSTIDIAGVRYSIDLSRSVVQRINGSIPVYDIRKIADNEFSIIIDGHSCHVFLSRVNGSVHATIRNITVEIGQETARDTLLSRIQKGKDDSSKTFTQHAPMPGLIAKITGVEGTQVQSDEGILVVEAMKMENEIKAPRAGIIKKIFVKEKQSVEKNDKLFTIDFL